MRLIFDSHLDLAWNALSFKRDITQPLPAINAAQAHLADQLFHGRATVSLPAMRAAGVAVCLATLMGRVPYQRQQDVQAVSAIHDVHTSTLDFPSHAQAHAFAQGQLAYYEQLHKQNEINILKTASQLRSHWARWQQADASQRMKLPIGVILAMEGCDAIISPEQTDQWFDRGLRSAALVHYGQSQYAAGTGTDGPLTPAGRYLLDTFRRCGMILDVTHLSDTSFHEALNVFDGPIHASHQNCRVLVPGDRQFSDEQIKTVIQRGGVLGVAMDTWMLHPGWVRGQTLQQTTPRANVPLHRVADHINHIRDIAGNTNHVAIGSDLDGGFGTEQSPAGLDSIADLQKIDPILKQRNYNDTDINNIFHNNWLRFFEQHLPA